MANVMVIDDEYSIRTTVKKFLEREGHQVKSAENVREAL